MLKVMVVDDEPSARSRLKRVLEPLDVEVIGEASDGVEAVAAIEDLRPDLVFLDVQMPGMDGFEVLRSLAEPWPLVIFATAFDQYALRAFEANAVGYLLKPVDRDQLAKSLDRARRLIAEPQAAEIERDNLAGLAEQTKGELSQILARRGPRRILIPTDEAMAFLIEDGLVKVRTAHGLLRTDYGLADLEQRLPQTEFFRVHRGALVNLTAIGEIAAAPNGALVLTLKDEDATKIVASERQTPALRKRLRL